MATASVTAGTSREQHEPASPGVRPHILPSPRRSALFDPQVAQQPVGRLLVDVVILPAGEVTDVRVQDAQSAAGG
jgi:hypothetical protein